MGFAYCYPAHNLGYRALTNIVNYIIIHVVNNNYSSPVIYYERWLTPVLAQAIQDHSVVILTGARQVGKSTLLLNAPPFKDWRYYSLDDYDILRQIERDPAALWAGANQIILDEAQKAPELLSAVKLAVDQHPGRYRFLLSGSTNFLLMKQVSESLAGRAVYFVLDPLSLGEIRHSNQPDFIERLLAGEWPPSGELLVEPLESTRLMLRGMMPPLIAMTSAQAWIRWWEEYIATYLERDLRQLAQIEALLDFRRLMELTALRSGQLINQSELARDARISQSTVHRYLNLLETTYLFERLPAYTASHTTRLLKSPKAFWNDTGLAVHLSGYYSEQELLASREFGAFFETLIYHHLRVLARLMSPAGKLYFWRTNSGSEVDFVFEHGRRLLAIEVKHTSHPRYGDASGLRVFLEEHPHTVGGLLLHTGREIRMLDKNIIAVPWFMLAE